MRRIAFICLPLALLFTACSNSNKVTGGDSQTSAGTQSETDATTSWVGGPNNRIVVAFNDETGEQQLITFTATDRVVSAGASDMGWSYSDDLGKSWNYGGHINPPQGWSVIWSDPAVTTSGAAYNVVFLSALAVPTAKFPAGGIHGYLYYGDGRSSYIGGACIFKSTDGGKTFSFFQGLSNQQAVAGVPDSGLGHFYDGGSMASNSAGEVFAAYIDYVTDLVDVYRSPSANGSFSPLPTPFPGLSPVTHPILRTGPDNSLYVAEQMVGTNNQNYIYMNRFANGSWGTPVRVSDGFSPGGFIDFHTVVQGSELTLRNAQQFSFDIGAASDGGGDAMRLLYTRQDNTGHMMIDAVACSADLSTCGRVAGWQFQGGGPGNTPVDVYNPEVRAWRGFIGLPPTWQATWGYHYGSVNFINVSRATLGYVNGNALIIPVDIVQNAPVCSDTRGYWGDYDGMVLMGFTNNGGSQWMRFVADSSAGCNRRWEFTAESQHVQQANYTY